MLGFSPIDATSENLKKKTWWQHLWIYCPNRWWIIILIFKIKFSSRSGNIGTIWCQNESIQLLWLITAFYVHENMSSRSIARFPFLIIVLCCKQHGFHSIQQLNWIQWHWSSWEVQLDWQLINYLFIRCKLSYVRTYYGWNYMKGVNKALTWP